jgi:hypothetical protein
MCHLQLLDVSSNRLGYAAFNFLGRALAVSKSLTELDISANCIGRAPPVSPGCSFPVRLNSQHDATEGRVLQCKCYRVVIFDAALDAASQHLNEFTAGIAGSAKLFRLNCSCCGFKAEHLVLICAAACVSTSLRILGAQS